MKSYFAYIRVSTVRQGEHGSSLQEQKAAIVSFAAKNDFHISVWFEERETAATIGRFEFSRMVAALKKGKAAGVIFHKIDRSARNLKDWSAVQDLAEQGVDVRFTQESINLASNEGKLTGDFLAVISSHYIRNLRQEVKKGIQGRLKQGLYPMAAPLGYLDQGGGKPKIPDPTRAPMIRDAFELYASGLSLHALSDELYKRGLRTKSGKKLGINSLADMLRNPFYMGIIRMKRAGSFHSGVHQPLIPRALFETVQRCLDGRANVKTIKHDFIFRRMLTCANCKYRLIGEKQKGHVYFRCHTKACLQRSIREDVLDQALERNLKQFEWSEEEFLELYRLFRSFESEWNEGQLSYGRAIVLQRESVERRLARLMDAYLDDTVERSLFEQKKYSLLKERVALEERQSELANDGRVLVRRVEDFLERVKTLPLSYISANPAEKRDLLKTITSNLFVDRENVVVELRSPFREVENLVSNRTGGAVRGDPRTRAKKIFEALVKHFKNEHDATL